jgi:hypothetical protein
MKLPFLAGSLSRLNDRGQHIRIAGQEPAAVGLFAVDRHAITSKPSFLSAGAWRHGE